MTSISTLIEKRSCLEQLKAEHPELADLIALIDEMIAAIVDLHMRTGTVTITADPTITCPAPQSTMITMPNINATAVGTYLGNP